MNEEETARSGSASAPRFAGRIQVDQTASGLALSGFLATGLLGALPGFALGVLALEADPDATGWRALVSTLGMLGGVVLAIVGLFAGMMYWFVLEQRWLAWRGKLPFSAVARVEIDERGLAVEGLGQLGWREVLNWEGVPDSDSALIVHTQRHGGLLLRAAVDDMIPSLAYFLPHSGPSRRCRITSTSLRGAICRARSGKSPAGAQYHSISETPTP